MYGVIVSGYEETDKHLEVVLNKACPDIEIKIKIKMGNIKEKSWSPELEMKEQNRLSNLNMYLGAIVHVDSNFLAF